MKEGNATVSKDINFCAGLYCRIDLGCKYHMNRSQEVILISNTFAMKNILSYLVW